MPAPNEITPTQLLRLIGTPDCPGIIDLTTDDDFAEDPVLIPTAIRHPHTDIAGLIARLAGRKAVITCQKGKKLSQGAVSWLRGEGIAAEYLQGGMQGWRATKGSLSVPAAALPAPVEGATLWVTRHRPKIDRIACPWLIRRFLDRKARVLFVAPAEVAGVAERFGATPFDTEGAVFGHVGGNCSFDAFLGAFGLQSGALMRMADIIRAADTGRPETVPQAAGLLAFSVGLSRQYKDDAAQLAAALPFYDALYRWARDGYDEVHLSNPGQDG